MNLSDVARALEAGYPNEDVRQLAKAAVGILEQPTVKLSDVMLALETGYLDEDVEQLARAAVGIYKILTHWKRY